MLLSSVDQITEDLIASVDVIVVGAGLVGLTIASDLSNSGVSVLVIESGSIEQSEQIHPLNRVEMLGDFYDGALVGRFRCLGGTSTRWGGALLPFSLAVDEANQEQSKDLWGIGHDLLQKYGQSIEKTFKLSHDPFDLPECDLGESREWRARMPKWPAFRNRSTRNLFYKEIHQGRKFHVLVNATVVKIYQRDFVVEGVLVKSSAGKELKIPASRVVLSAGAIENTRALHQFFSELGPRTKTPSDLGSYFHDHLSGVIAELRVKDFEKFSDHFCFRFGKNGEMRSLRFELAPDAVNRLKLPPSFMHVSFDRVGKSGFDGLRGALQSIQRGALPRSDDLFLILSDWKWFLSAVWWRFVKKRLLPPRNSVFKLHLVTEQIIQESNQIALSDASTDHHGVPLASINWKISVEDQENFSRVAKFALESWRTSLFSCFADAIPVEMLSVGSQVIQETGIYHPAGTTRMGVSNETAVLDTELAVFGVEGLWAVSTSSLPRLGSSSPSMTALQLGLHAANSIKRQVRRQMKVKVQN